ncbi:hypothetical protein L9F63_012193, partial [Diploptera punctata]
PEYPTSSSYSSISTVKIIDLFLQHSSIIRELRTGVFFGVLLLLRMLRTGVFFGV